jgi:polysaccharide export outer membrane protein
MGDHDSEARAGPARRRFRRWGMAAGIATAGALVLAMWLATTVSVSAQDRGLGEYRLAPDDRLSIVVFGQTELSGDFAVDGAGRIVLPIVGQVSVGELTVAEAQERIQRSFADGVLVQPTVAVRIAEYRPVFIVGDVRTPGSYPFRFGQFVKTAIAMAGGHGRPTDQQNVAMSDFISADERVRVLETTRRILLVRKARLDAQREGAAEFVAPSFAGAESSDHDLDALMASETDILVTLTQAHHKQLDALRLQRPRLEAEIKALSGQEGKQRQQLAFAKERVEEVDALVKAGKVQRNVLLERQRDEVRIESELLQLSAQVARLEQSIGDINLRIDEAEVTYRRQVIGDLQDTLQRLREVEVTLTTAREMRQLRAQYAGGIEGIEAAHTILITRTRMRGATTFQAGGETLLEPGDVVEVKRQRQGLPQALGLAEGRREVERSSR